MARPEISSTNGASIFMNFLFWGFTTTCSFEKNGNDLLKNLNEESHASINLLIQRHSSCVTPGLHCYVSLTLVRTLQIYVHVYLLLQESQTVPLHLVNYLPELSVLLRQTLTMWVDLHHI